MINQNKKLNNIKIARVATIPFFIETQLQEQIKFTNQAGAKVTLVSSENNPSQKFFGSDYVSINIPRNINLFRDFIALIRLWLLFRKTRFDIVHSVTPKAGLLCCIASKFSGVSVRLHTFTGQPWVELSGYKYFFSKSSDKIIGILNTHCYADSNSQKKFLLEEGVLTADKVSVLGLGSLAGVDLKRFNPNLYSMLNRSLIKKSLGIPKNAFVILFLGRVVRDKGIIELVSAFNSIFLKNENIYLLLSGPQELSLLDLGVKKGSELEKRIKFTGYTEIPEQYMAASNVLCIPSYREGFSTVVIEAAAMGLPAIGTNIYGLIDSIIDGETGLLVESKNVKQLANALLKFFNDIDLCQLLGKTAQKRVIKYFSSELINQQVIDEYARLLLEKKGS